MLSNETVACDYWKIIEILGVRGWGLEVISLVSIQWQCAKRPIV